MMVDLQSLLEIIIAVGSVLTMFYKVASSVKEQSIKIDELTKEIKKLENYEEELLITKKEIVELKYAIQNLNSHIQAIEEAMRELKQDKKILFEIINNMSKHNG